MHKKFVKIMKEVHDLFERRAFLRRMENVSMWTKDSDVREAAKTVYEGIKDGIDMDDWAKRLRLRITEAIELGYVSAEIGDAIASKL